MPVLAQTQSDDRFEPILQTLAESRQALQELVAGLAEDNVVRDLQSGTIDERIDKLLKLMADRNRKNN
jgi:hypothetical protein